MTRWHLVIAGVFAAVLQAGCATPAAPGAGDVSWHGIFLDGDRRIGASSQVVTPWQGGEQIDDASEMFFSEADRRVVRVFDRSTRFVDAEGRTVRIERESGNGHDVVRVDIALQDSVAVVTRQTRYDQSAMRVDLPPDVRLDDGVALLRRWDFSAGELSFDSFNAVAVTVERVVMRLLSSEAAAGTRRIERAAYRNGALSSVSELTLDAHGEVLQTSLDQFGARMVVRPISAAEAVIPGSPVSFVASTMVKSPNRISTRATKGHIRYVFGFAEGRVFEFPQTSEQRSVRDGDEAVVDICVGCGHGLSVDPAFLAAGLKSTMWLQSGSEKVRELAAFGPEETFSDRKKMDVLGGRVRRVLNKRDFTGHYSALEAAERGAGDCTEDAVLLTALARAAGIPAYVATGLVYSREQYHGVSNAFMPHNWTVAYVDGAWTSFDISLEEFDATHIALSVNEGEASALASAQQLSSQLEWRRMSEVRDSASPPEATP
jgi:hypothetical protein